MVCKDCEKKSNTVLATPQVKKKHEVQSSSHDMKKPTLGNTGVVKSKLLSRSGKNPYAAYASADCKATSCFKKVEAGKKYCATCGYSQQCMYSIYFGVFKP